MAGDGLAAVVGRNEQLSRIESACRAARDGQGCAICLVGPAGIGKTLLLRTARSFARSLHISSATSSCWAQGAPPLFPWLDVLDQLDAAPVVAATAGQQGLPAFQRIERAVAAVAYRIPLLIAIDDLHSGDEATMLLTRYLAGRARDLPVVLLLARRPAESLPDGSRERLLLTEIDRSCDVLTLSPLSSGSIAELAVNHGHPALPGTVVQALTVVSGGIPLHAVAALDAWPPGAPEPDLTARLQERVMHRMRGLSTDDAAILARAAVLGRVVSVDAAARVTGTSKARLATAVAAARSVELIRPSRPAEIDFGHDLVREAVVEWLDPTDLASTHAAAAAFYRAHTTDGRADLVRAARHALQAAHRSPTDAAQAVELGRKAAAALADGGAPEDAVALLEQTLAISGMVGGQAPTVTLLIERASAVLLAGRLSAAHQCFTAATDAALAAGDVVALAEAAAGLGALWVNAVRSPVEQRRILRIQRDAVRRLPAGHESLRIRLRARIAAEAMFWEGADAGDLFDVLDDSRAHSDPASHLEVLSVAHNPLLGPEHNALRMRLSQEMLEISAATHQGILPLMALCWHAVNLFLAGDGRAERALADLQGAAEAVQSISVMYIVREIQTMLLIRRGRFADAETAAAEAFELGSRAEDADAMSYLGSQLVAIRWFQGREAEMLDLVEQIAVSAQIDGVDHSFEAAVAALASRAGVSDIARRHLDRVKGAGLHTVPRFSTWLVTMATVIEAAVALNDKSTAAEAYDLLQPFADLPVTPSLAIVCFGSVHQWLGSAALALNRPELAERHWRAAVNANQRIGHIPATAVARSDLARVLITHRRTHSRESEARDLIATALITATEAGMTALSARLDEMEAELQRSPTLLIEPNGSSGNASWTVDFADRQVTVRDLAGMRMLSKLTRAPGQWLPASQLAYDQPPGTTSRHALMDDIARRALETRLRHLVAAVGQARDQGDVKAQEVAETEMDSIAEQLSAATGLLERGRSFPDETERARTSVRKAIVRAIEEIEQGYPRAAAHLRSRVVTGSQCRYDA